MIFPEPGVHSQQIALRGVTIDLWFQRLMPASSRLAFHVRVTDLRADAIDRARIEALVKEATPAHIVVHVEVID